jgi:hypothetical protein
MNLDISLVFLKLRLMARNMQAIYLTGRSCRRHGARHLLFVLEHLVSKHHEVGCSIRTSGFDEQCMYGNLLESDRFDVRELFLSLVLIMLGFLTAVEV